MKETIQGDLGKITINHRKPTLLNDLKFLKKTINFNSYLNGIKIL